MKKIYLCGPIMDEKEGLARQWREIALAKLSPNFIMLDPMRRDFKDREVDSANEIVDFDLQDVRDADIVLVNYSKASVGTAMEVFFASHGVAEALTDITQSKTFGRRLDALWKAGTLARRSKAGWGQYPIDAFKVIADRLS